MNNARPLSSIGASLANRDFISPVRGVYEGYLGATEELVEDLLALRSSEVAFDEFDIWQFGQLVDHKTFSVPYLRFDMPTHGGSRSYE